MSSTTSIEWTDTTWNPIVGCSVISPGCTNCYAMKFAGNRLQHLPAYEGLTRSSKAGPVWTGEVRRQDSVLFDPLSWRKPRRVFVNSMSDLFHENVADAVIAQIFAVMAACPQHQFQVLTKRAERMRAWVSKDGRDLEVWAAMGNVPGMLGCAAPIWPLPNVWLGVSAEDQTRWNERVQHLIETPAATRFVSAEPLIGPIWGGTSQLAQLDWVIVGGESGPKARPMHPAWAIDMRDRCAFYDVAFFFKQWGEWAPRGCTPGHWLTPDGRLIGPCDAADVDDDEDGMVLGYRTCGMSRIGKKNAGRMLDGRTHDEFPKQ